MPVFSCARGGTVQPIIGHPTCRSQSGGLVRYGRSKVSFNRAPLSKIYLFNLLRDASEIAVTNQRLICYQVI